MLTVCSFHWIAWLLKKFKTSCELRKKNFRFIPFMLILKYSIPNLAIVLITYFSKHYFFPVFLLLVGGPYSPSPKMRDFWEWKEFTDNYTETELKIGTDARQMGHKVMIFIAGNVDQEWYYSERSFLCAETLKSALRNCKVAGRIRSAYRFRHTECQAVFN